MATSEAVNPNYQILTNETGRVFRVGEDPKQILGYPRGLVIMAAWLAMCLAGLLEYTWAALSGSLAAAHHWGAAPTFWLFSFFVIFESFVQIGTGYLRNRGILNVRWATIIGGIVCGIIGYAILAESTTIWTAYLGYAVLGGIGSGMVYSSCINIVPKWYPEKKGWRTGFVNGGWAYGAVPFIIAIGGFTSGSGMAASMSPGSVKTFIFVQGSIMTVGIALAGWFLKDPPKNWWPKQIDPLNWHKRSTRDLKANPPALRHYTLAQMWRTPQAKWLGLQYAFYVGCSLFGVAYYYGFGQAMGLGKWAYVGGAAGFALADGLFRPVRCQLPDDGGDRGGLLRRNQQRGQLRFHLRVQGARRQLRRRRRRPDHDRHAVRDRDLPLAAGILLRRRAGRAGRADGHVQVQAPDRAADAAGRERRGSRRQGEGGKEAEGSDRLSRP